MSIETLHNLWTQTTQAACYLGQQAATGVGYLARGGANVGGYIVQGASATGQGAMTAGGYAGSYIAQGASATGRGVVVAGGYIAQGASAAGRGAVVAGGYIAQGASAAGAWTVHVLSHVAQFTGTQLCYAGGALLDLSKRAAIAAAPHVDRFKNFALKTAEENKVELMIAGSCLVIGGIIGAAIAGMWRNNAPPHRPNLPEAPQG